MDLRIAFPLYACIHEDFAPVYTYRAMQYTEYMAITQTVDIPASRRLVIEVPREVPAGRVILTFTPAPGQAAAPSDAAVTEEDAALAASGWYENGGECPLCAKYGREPNAETIAAIEEGEAMTRGEIPSRLYHSFEEMLADLDAGDD